LFGTYAGNIAQNARTATERTRFIDGNSRAAGNKTVRSFDSGHLEGGNDTTIGSALGRLPGIPPVVGPAGLPRREDGRAVGRPAAVRSTGGPSTGVPSIAVRRGETGGEEGEEN
jgi:hypothetical protein